MKIDLNDWKERIVAHGKLLSLEQALGGFVVDDQPRDFFEDFFTDDGYPGGSEYYPIWEEKGLVIQIKSGETYVFNIEYEKWNRYSEKSQQRVFWINEEGIWGEVDKSYGNILEFFPVTTPEAVVEYISFVCSKQLGRRKAIKERTLPLSKVIENCYVHFFKYPDDISVHINQMPWVKYDSLIPLILRHSERNAPWLMSLILEVKITESRLSYDTDGNQNYAVSFQIENIDIAKQIPWQELMVFAGLIKSTSTLKDLKEEYFDAASKLSTSEILEDPLKWRIQIHEYCYISDQLGNAIMEVAVLPNEEIFPDYISERINPSVQDIISKYALSPFSEQKDAKDLKILLPSIGDQKRISFESLSYRHAIDQQSKRLSQFQEGRETTFELHRLLVNRYEEVVSTVSRLPKKDTELERAQYPLPYFLEAPLIVWERSDKNFKAQNGFICFGNLLKQVSLLGLCELQVVLKANPDLWDGDQNGLNEKQDLLPIDRELLAGIQGNPSLGHWSRFIDWIAPYERVLPMFGKWVSILRSVRKQTIEIIELRNKHAHSSSILERSFYEEIEAKLASFFSTVISTLRKEHPLHFLLPISRKAVREGNSTKYVFTCRNLNSAHSRYNWEEIEVGQEAAGAIVEFEIIAMKPDDPASLVSLNSFYQYQEVTADQFDILIYEKKYDGSGGVFCSIDAPGELRCPMPNSPLSVL